MDKRDDVIALVFPGPKNFQFRLFLGEQAHFHCSLSRVGFSFQQVSEPVDVRLDDPAHRKTIVPTTPN